MGFRMAIIDLFIGILASPAQVWAYLADMQRQPQWMTGIRSFEITSESVQGIGSSFRVISRGPLGMRVVDEMVCTEWGEGEVLTMEHRGSIKGRSSFTLMPIELGTSLRWREELRMPLGWLGEVAFRLMFRGALRRTFRQDLRNLKAQVEGGKGTAGPSL